MKKNASRKFVMFISMGDITITADVASEFICRMYVQHKAQDVNEDRYIKMLEMSRKVDQVN